MKYFARLIEELQNLVKIHRAGDTLTPPALLKSLQIDGRRVSYLHMGLDKSGPAVLLVHGFGGFFMDWPRVMVPLSKRAPVYALDLPGWGFSEPRDHAEGLEDDVAIIAEFIRQNNLEEVILVGISYGAAVAWASAAQGISKVKRVVLLNPMPPHPLRHLKSLLYRLIFFVNRFEFTARWSSRFLTKSQYKWVCKENLKNYRLLDSLYLEVGFFVLRQPFIYRNLHSHAKKAFSINWEAWAGKLRDIQIPVTIMQGLDDKVFTMASARYLHSLIPHAELIEVKDCGHAMVFDQHKKITATLIHSLRKEALKITET